MKTFYIRSIISTHVYTYIMENCKIIMNIKNKMSKKKKRKKKSGQCDLQCKIKETLLIRDLKPALNENVGSENLLLY